MNSLKNMNKDIVALFSGQSSIVTTPKLYIELTTSYVLAIILNQCVFWSTKSKSKDGWFYKTYDDWLEEIHIPERTLRRKLDRLEQRGFITTKIKKVGGINVKHVYTHVDKIIESITAMLDTDCPNRPLCPAPQNSANDEQNDCTIITPTGQLGRSEPATLSDSTIYTDENLQMKSTNCKPSSSSFSFSETIDREILNQKLFRDERTDEEFMNQVIEHVENHSDKQYSRIQRAQGALKLLRKLKAQNVLFYVKGKQPKEEMKPKQQSSSPFTEDERLAVQDYNHAKKMESRGALLNAYIMPERVEFALSVIERMKAMEAKSCQPSNNARSNSLTSVLNLVSRHV